MNTPAADDAYPQDLETWRTAGSGLKIFLRPIRRSDGPRHKSFLQSLSSQSVYLKFFRLIRPTDDFVERLVDVDYIRQMAFLALTYEGGEEKVLGMGRYILNKDGDTAEVYFAVRDDYQGRGIGRELVSHILRAARKRGLKGLTAEVMVDNRRMLRLFRSFEGKEYRIRIRMEAGIFYLDMDLL